MPLVLPRGLEVVQFDPSTARPPRDAASLAEPTQAFLHNILVDVYSDELGLPINTGLSDPTNRDKVQGQETRLEASGSLVEPGDMTYLYVFGARSSIVGLLKASRPDLTDEDFRPRGTVELEELDVRRRERGQGVGPVLLQRLAHHPQLTGEKEILSLTVVGANHRAQKFYERWGFRFTGQYVYHRDAFPPKPGYPPILHFEMAVPLPELRANLAAPRRR
jgi:ribosomal protein S18 acetylase RimI-like enzyme